MRILLFIGMFAFFFIYPTIGIFMQRITIKTKTIYLSETPLTFWSTIIFLYFSGIALPCVMLRVPYSFLFIPVMIVLGGINAICYIFKL